MIDPTKQTIKQEETKHDTNIHPPRILIKPSTLQNIVPCHQTTPPRIPCKALTSHTPILIRKQSIQRIPIKRHIVHEKPVLGDVFFRNEVAGEEKKRSQNRANQRIPRYEIRGNRAQEHHQGTCHQDYEPNQESEKCENRYRRVKPHDRSNRRGRRKGRIRLTRRA